MREGEGVVNGAGGGEEQSMHLHPEASVGALPMQGFAREQDWESSLLNQIYSRLCKADSA